MKSRHIIRALRPMARLPGKFALIVAALAILGGAAHAFDLPGLKPGAAIPAFTLADQSGKSRSFDNLRGEKGLVLVFVRSADWCPFCKAQLKELHGRSADFTGRGYGLASISYDDAGKIAAFARKQQISYPMLADTGSALIKAFGILNQTMAPDSGYYGIPHPAVYIIGSDGTIAASFAEESYRERPQIDAILGWIDRAATTQQ